MESSKVFFSWLIWILCETLPQDSPKSEPIDIQGGEL